LTVLDIRLAPFHAATDYSIKSARVRRRNLHETFTAMDYETALEAIRGIYDAKIRAGVDQRW
jgi:hypothetical protein